MLKIVVFDSGIGGELFADQLERDLPIVEVIRVIDWRNADKINKSPREACKLAEQALRPYIGTVDLIIFANYLLTLAGLKHFRHKYRHQQFIGLSLPYPTTKATKHTLVLATTPVAHTFGFQHFLFQLRRPTTVLYHDEWPALIDDGKLNPTAIQRAIQPQFGDDDPVPDEVILACAHFSDFKLALRHACGYNRAIKIYDGFDATIRLTCRLLKIRGGTGKKPN